MRASIAPKQAFVTSELQQAFGLRPQAQAKPAPQRQSVKQDFDSYYDEHIQQAITDFIAEKGTNSPASNMLFWVGLLGAVAAGLLIGLYALPNVTDNALIVNFLLPFCFFPAVLLLIFSKSIKRWISSKRSGCEISEKLNSIIVPQIFQYFGEGCTLTRDPTLDYSDLNKLGIKHEGYRHYCQDGIRGERNGIAFKMAEVKIEKAKKATSMVINQLIREMTRIRLRTTYYQTVFKGVYLLLDVPKPFLGRVDIKHDSKKYKNAITNTFSEMNRVRLEDPEFEKAFEVYSECQTEARYLLTTSMMQSLNELRVLLGGSSLEASFSGGKLSLMIDCPENLFEVSADLEEEEYREEAKKVLRDLTSIFKAIDTMDLKQQSIV